MWSKQRFSALLRRCRIISKTIIARQALKKSIYLKTLFLQQVLLTSRQQLGSWGHKKSKVIFGQINVFGLLCFIFKITIEGWFRHHRFSVVKPVQMMYNTTSKGQVKKLTSVQGHQRSWHDRNKPYCISVNAYGWYKHIVACFTSLFLFYPDQFIKKHRWSILTSDDTAVTDEKLHLGQYKRPPNVWSWKNWAGPMCFDEGI